MCNFSANNSRCPVRPARMQGKVDMPVVLMLAVVGLLGTYYFSARDSESSVRNELQFPTMQEPAVAGNGFWKGSVKGAEERLNSLPPTAAGKPEPAAAGERGDRARVVIARFRDQAESADLGQLFSSAEQFRQGGMLADAHLLYFFAARKGHGPSAMVLGTMYDPNYHSDMASIVEEPDPFQARKWYQLAAKEGDMMAKAQLGSLREQVEVAAAGGDVEAERMLMQW